MNDILSATCVLTVTYGSRFHFLAQTIEAALAAGAGAVLVVDNCADDGCRAGLAQLQERYGAQLGMLSLPENNGSAGGFKAGLAHILERRRFDYIWLLDDDNVPESDALSTLVACYRTLTQKHSYDRLALLSLRDVSNKLKRIAAGLPPDLAFPRRSSFQKLHVLGELAKFYKRLVCRRQSAPVAAGECIAVPFAPYGGLFFHRDLLARIGLPDEHLFLYADDSKFSYNLTCQGGAIYLVPASRIKDIDQAWRKRAVSPSVLMSDSDFRVYYSVRNNAYFYLYYWADNRPMYYLNMFLYCTGMAWLALLRGRWARFRLICRAIREGHRRQLGRRDDLPNSPSSIEP
jgi:GT2 family glycosyltransferase